MKFIISLIFCFTLFFSFAKELKPETKLTDQLVIQVENRTREFFFTNKISGFYYGETNDNARNGWQGWTVSEKKIFSDYEIEFQGKILDRSKSKVSFYPYEIERRYKEGIFETFSLADSLDAILIELKNIKSNFVFRINGFSSIQSIKFDSNLIKVILERDTLRLNANSKILSVKNYDNDLELSIERKNTIRIVIALENPNTKNHDDLLSSFDDLIRKKKNRIEKLLQRSWVETNDKELNKALAWNKITLDALITNQGMKGIFAGLPWFNNYWGRDTFISLPGATLTQGNFDEAKEILHSFAEAQNCDTSSKYYGRIPNRITLGETIYNTADGTPWFVINAMNYIKYSGDVDFARQIYPSVNRAIDGISKYYLDGNYFLTHEDAETWMDAVGPNGPWSPRGNRANDVQALWYRQLKSSADIALLNQDTIHFNHWIELSNKLAANIKKYFIDTVNFLIYDHLNKDNSVDNQIRPNLFFLLNEPDFFEDEYQRFRILKKAIDKLVFPYGVLSLSYEDDNFHPYHHYQPYYVQDAAYHNGIIWLWNFRQAVKSLLSYRLTSLSYTLTKELTRQTLYEGCIGSLSELTDAFPRKNENRPRLSGTFAQAWSMAEYIRTFYDDYLGVQPNALKNSLHLQPNLPNDLREIKFNHRIKNHYLIIHYKRNKNSFQIVINGDSIEDSLYISVKLHNRTNKNFFSEFIIRKNEQAEITLGDNATDLKGLKINIRNISPIICSYVEMNSYELQDEVRSVNFAKPTFNPNWKSIRNPGYQLLSHSQIKFFNPHTRSILKVDSSRKINFNYSYPLNTNFKSGILNLESFELKEDERHYFFRLKFENLHDPGWHREYGFQLTFCVIALQTEKYSARSVEIGLNSNFVLEPERAFDKIIVVGGGIEIRDNKQKTIAAYFPKEEDISNPLGNVKSKEITFTLPKLLIGKISIDSKITILVGAQDDHGGAGIGEFRSIDRNSSEWLGGGKINPSDPNVYEILKIN